MKTAVTVAALVWLLLVCQSYAWTINEVMVSGDEWIEICNPEAAELNLSLWKIRDNSTSNPDRIICENKSCVTNATHFLILGHNVNITTITNENVTYFYIDDKRIGNGLNNDADTINITGSNSSFIFSYNTSAEDESWSRIPDCYGNFTLARPTPGFENTRNDTSKKACDIAIRLETNDIFTGTLKYFIILNDSVCEGNKKEAKIEYWIENLFGDIIKNPHNTTVNITCFENISRKWTPRNIHGVDAFIIKAKVHALCNDTYGMNNYAEKIVILKGLKPEQESSIHIMKLYLGSDEKAKFGDIIKVKVSVYKGDTTKSSVKAWLEDDNEEKISRVTYANFYSKFSNNTLTLPLLINPNCDHKKSDGDYYIVVSGLGKIDRRKIRVEGISKTLCKTNKVYVPCSCQNEFRATQEAGITADFVDYPKNLYPNEEFNITVLVSNNMDKPINITIYSYIYKNGSLFSYGLGKGGWVKKWDANKLTVNISGNSARIVSLGNRVIGNAGTGEYKLKARIKLGNKKIDITRFVNITEPERIDVHIQSKVNKSHKKVTIPTAGVVASRRVSIFDIIINFFKNLLNL